MIRFYSAVILLSSVLTVWPQAGSTEIFRSAYSALGIIPRVENDGIYGISSFDVDEHKIALTLKDESRALIIDADKNISYSALSNTTSYLLDAAIAENLSPEPETNAVYKMVFTGGRKTALADAGGILGTTAGEIRVNCQNRSLLKISSNLSGYSLNADLSFSNDLACADFIGADSKRNTFLLIEKYLSEIPLAVERYIYCLSPAGEILSILKLPAIKFLSLETEFRIDSDGNFYHLITDQNGLAVVKWTGLTEINQGIIKYPAKYSYTVHFNKFVSRNELKNTSTPEGIELAAGRAAAIRLGETYVYHRYNVTSANLAPANVTAPDGDIVRTPPWLIAGRNARIPYKWGGFNTLAQFDAGLAANKYAGDINTSGVSSYALGVDCSGFVSRCWQMTYHASTSYMPNITTQYASWDSLKPADAIHKVGHVRLFIERNPNGSFKVVESAGRNWDVSYYSFLASDLTEYTPRYYNNMQNDYTAGRPQMIAAVISPVNQIKLSWSSDTAGIAGYRLYRSFDGINYNLVMNETSLKTNSVTVPQEASQAYYRVAKVLNNPPLLSESNWSNSISAFNSGSEKKYLIIDGFSREIGSWQGPGHNFVVNYAKALKTMNYAYDAVRSSYLSHPSVNLNDYSAIIWIAGDESLLDETFSDSEQSLIKNYLESGGKLFVSGSEIGWDLYSRGSVSDKFFYNNYLKANFLSDDAGSLSVSGVTGTAMQGFTFAFGQSYDEDFPDEIGGSGGSIVCMKYSNGKGAGIQYAGTFGNSSMTGKLIYLAFPMETTADDSSFNRVIRSADDFFSSPISGSVENRITAAELSLCQNFPNPASGETTIRYSIPAMKGTKEESRIQIRLYDLLGREVRTLVDRESKSGNYSETINISGLPTGIYFCSLTFEGSSVTRKLTVLR